jgi:hypothetical protein
LGQVRWLTPTILVILEAEIGRIVAAKTKSYKAPFTKKQLENMLCQNKVVNSRKRNDVG